MRKICLLVVLCVSVVFGLEAQDAKAGAILDAMSANYKNMKSFTASFSYAPVSASGKMGRARSGSIAVKGVKFKLNMVGQEIYNDGSNIYSFVKETNEVNITEYDASEDSQFSPANIYSIYKNGYKYSYQGEKNIGGELCQVVELQPLNGGNVKKIEIGVVKSSKNVKSWKLWDSSGKQTAFTITKFNGNAALSDAYFKFDTGKHPGVEVVDLR
ncbi:outer membrane lipoprotein carrier protein LolA [Marinilongibacter aquaticus]|uniref:LolA family protein n=1 Tax=Marinilongibacter aquaticus TaxID=2975157 RepID=UPI0021BD47BA|nr:outer membrane lipoprotein carrier protein LolA [Marinilongibacter aquaticus]UBM57855.1 outer membrane lipoprotein carrier protein LolA [Marinilongibacter aquaticus]